MSQWGAIMSTDASELARTLAARRPRATYVCEVCDREFEAVMQAGARVPTTCSTSCRQKRFRRAKAETKAEND